MFGPHWHSTLIATTVAALACGGCAEKPNEEGTASTAQSASVQDGPVDAEMLKLVEHELDVVYKGTDRVPPASSPKPERGKNVWIISPGQGGESASIAVNAAKEAGDAIGWKTTIFDGQGDASRYPVGVRQAVAAKADAIIVDALDCGWIRQPLVEARAAKVKVVAFTALDCDDPILKGAPLFDATVSFKGEYEGKVVTDFRTQLRLFGAVKADWIIAKTHGRARVVQFYEDEFLTIRYIREGFERQMAKCKTCQIVKTVDFNLGDLGPGLAQKTQGALLQHPEANALVVPYDTAMLAVAPAVRESGRADKLAVMGGEGFPTNIQLIRDRKGQDAAVAVSAQWMGYAAVDALNNVFAGQPVGDSGIGITVIDREHNLPSAGDGFETKVDFRSAYHKAWGISR